MAGSDTASESAVERNKMLRDELNSASSKISDTVRYTALGQIGATYAVIVSNTPFAVGMMKDHSTFIFFVLAFGCAALVFDFVQYLCTYARVVYLHEHPERDADRDVWHATAWLSFWTKSVLAFAGMLLLGFLVFSVTYFAKTSASDKAAHAEAPHITEASKGPVALTPPISSTARHEVAPGKSLP